MIIKEQEIQTIEEAFLLLPEEEQHHAKRVSGYTEAAFKKVTMMDLYISDPHSRVELDMDNIRSIRLGALYHDIGKLLPDEPAPVEGREISKEHCLNGAELAASLPPESGRFQPTERRIYLSCIREHHEMPCGGGSPVGKPMKELAFGGRLVAIADKLDHLAMNMKSEDPIGDAIAFLKKDAKENRIDPEFYRAFRAVCPRLRKIFDEYRSETKAVPANDPWIKRRGSRPFELRYCQAALQTAVAGEIKENISEPEISETEAYTADLPEKLWIAVMCFRNVSDNSCSYEDVKAILAKTKLVPDLGRYFLYELCDTIRRFDTVGAGLPAFAMELPAGWFSQKNLKTILQKVLLDEDTEEKRVILLTPPDMNKPQIASLEKQLAELRTFGIRVYPRDTFASAYGCQEVFKEGPEVSGVLKREDDIVGETLSEEA